MKQVTTTTLSLAGASVLGLLFGTALSFGLTESPFQFSDYVSAMVLSPFVMTFGIVVAFQYFSVVAGITMVAGMVVTVSSWVFGIRRKNRSSACLALLGVLAWSIWNVPIFHAIMSV